ncbi:MAG: C25 family cysteine peptidase [Chloroflexi bacterium]|nr:C25 family cysteine peptidase [Chloroflexota bacterium]
MNWPPLWNRSSPPVRPKGWPSPLVPVAEIYDEFGGGEATPDSLQTFIRYAAETWQAPSPRYLLLVGDATTDYRNYFDLAPANIVPSPLVAVAYSGETVSDSRLADIDDDGIPDLAVGRWPVNTPAEAASLVTRTLAYEEERPLTRPSSPPTPPKPNSPPSPRPSPPTAACPPPPPSSSTAPI